MRTINLRVPEMSELDAAQLEMILASTLYEQGKLSLGQAAAAANLSKRAFAELLGSYGVSIFNYSATDLAQDVANANAYAN